MAPTGSLPSHLQDRIDALETNQRDTDAQAFQKAVERRARVSFSVAIAGWVDRAFVPVLAVSRVFCSSRLRMQRLLHAWQLWGSI